MPSIFSRIVSGEIPCHKLAENEKFIAILDINPLAEGHALIIPKQEIDYIFDLPEDDLQEIMIFSKTIGNAIQKVVPCKRIGIAVIGLEVPHAHLHLIPINNVDDINFSRPKLKFPEEKYKMLAAEIRKLIG